MDGKTVDMEYGDEKQPMQVRVIGLAGTGSYGNVFKAGLLKGPAQCPHDLAVKIGKGGRGCRSLVSAKKALTKEVSNEKGVVGPAHANLNSKTEPWQRF